MGYYTRFEIGYDSSQSDPVELERFIEDLNSGRTFGQWQLRLDSIDGESMKWYSWKEDVEELSVEYPNVLLTLTGEGEEAGDLWRAYFMNGQSQVVQAKIIYDDPDYSQFKRRDLTGKRRAEVEAKRQALEAELARVKSELEGLSGQEG